jgi:hypothetical protein
MMHPQDAVPRTALDSRGRPRIRPGRTHWAAVAVAALILTGCAPSTGFSDLEREPSTEDSPPTELPDYAFDAIEAGSLRFIDVVQGRRVYLARGTEFPVCVLVEAGDADWFTTCGSSMTTTSSGDVEVMLVDDGMPDKDGWTRVGRNVLIKD